MKLIIEGDCNRGCVRSGNEDMVMIGKYLFRDEYFESSVALSGQCFFIAVADGMGGHEAGELASELVLTGMREAAESLPEGLSGSEIQAFLKGRIEELHTKLNNYGAGNGQVKVLGSTFTGVLVYGMQMFYVHVGDSRLYRLRGGILARISNDHSLSNLLNDSSIPQNQLANCFGGNGTGIFFDFEELFLFPSDVLLICSDGLSNELELEELEECLLSSRGVSDLISLAREKGGRDNLSCVKILVED